MTGNTITRVQIPLRISPDISRNLDDRLKDSPLSRNAWIEEAIAQRLQGEQVKQARLDAIETRLSKVETQLISPDITPVTFTQAAAELKARGRPICRKRLKKRLVESGGEIPAELFELGLRCDRASFDRGADKWLYFVEQKEVN